MEAPIPDAPSTIRNKGIIKKRIVFLLYTTSHQYKRKKREVGILYTNKERALLQSKNVLA
jgi:hypothetical protein